MRRSQTLSSTLSYQNRQPTNEDQHIQHNIIKPGVTSSKSISFSPSTRAESYSSYANNGGGGRSTPRSVYPEEDDSSDSSFARPRPRRKSTGHGLDTIPAGSSTSATSSHPRSSDWAGVDNGLEAKVVLLGSQGVGKSSLIIRYTSRTYSPPSTSATIGASLLTRKLVVDGVRVRLQIWDTAGQERFRSMAPMYYRGANAAILVYDITSLESFNDVKSWLDELRKQMPPDTLLHVVGAKSDLAPEHRAVTLRHARSEIARWLNPPSSTPPPETPSTVSGSSTPIGSFSRLRTYSLVPRTKSNSPPATSAIESLVSQDTGSNLINTPSRPGAPRARTQSSIQRRQSGDWTTSAVEAPGTPLPTATDTTMAVAISSTSTAPYQRVRRKSEEWSRRTSSYVSEESPFGGPIDMERQVPNNSRTMREPTASRVDGLALHGIQVWECSALKNEGIEELFQGITRQLVARRERIEAEMRRKERESVALPPPPPSEDKKKNSWDCCQT